MNMKTNSISKDRVGKIIRCIVLCLRSVVLDCYFSEKCLSSKTPYKVEDL